MKKILIIDDDLLNSQIYAAKLKSEGFEVELCSESTEALKKIKDHHDLIILDVMMPQMAGPQVLKELPVEIIKKTIILIYTNLVSDKTKQECLTLGAKDYLLKADFTPTQLVEKIKSYLPSST